MSPKKRNQLIVLNSTIVLVNIALFSDALLGLTLFAGTPLTISLAWMSVVGSVFAFAKGNAMILEQKETRLLLPSVRSLDDCIPVFQEAIHRGDIFDEHILVNIEQIKRFRRKYDAITDMLLQKFSAEEMSYQKFLAVLQEVESAVYVNMRSILNKIAAFDIDEYEALLRRGARGTVQVISQEKMDIYIEYIGFVKSATQANEDILLKMDKMLLEISRYNSLEDGDVQKLPAILEMDELIKNAKLYK